MPDAQRTYYQILGIDEGATSDEISAARRSMLREVHPDLAISEADRVERELLARAVNDMCDTLLDPIRRYDYDFGLARARDPFAADVSAAWRPSGHPRQPAAAEQDIGMYGPWLDESEWFTDVPSGPHPIVSRVPALAPFEPWLTWPIGILAVVMVGIATVIYDAAGSRLLVSAGLHIGRFGSLAVVLLLALVLVVLCLGALNAGRAVRARLGRHPGDG